MKLPVWPKDDRDIIDEDGCWVGFANTTATRDYIVKAINCHEKLLTVTQHLVESSTRHPKDYATENLNELIPYLIKEAKQALKETEKK